jgi:hypothetical protein
MLIEEVNFMLNDHYVKLDEKKLRFILIKVLELAKSRNKQSAHHACIQIEELVNSVLTLTRI